MADAIESFETKLDELTTKLDALRRKRTRIDAQIAETEDALRSLRRAVEILKLPVSEAMRRATSAVHPPTTRPQGVRPRVLDVILGIIEPGEVVRVQELLKRLESIPDYKLESRTPGSTVSTTLMRAADHFERLRKGVYRRKPQPKGEGQPM